MPLMGRHRWNRNSWQTSQWIVGFIVQPAREVIWGERLSSVFESSSIITYLLLYHRSGECLGGRVWRRGSGSTTVLSRSSGYRARLFRYRLLRCCWKWWWWMRTTAAHCWALKRCRVCRWRDVRGPVERTRHTISDRTVRRTSDSSNLQGILH